jgi:hypothetical protein
MTTYSLNNGSPTIPFTGYTNMLSTGGTDAAANGYVYNNGITQGDSDLARIFRNGAKGLVLRRLMTTLLGAGVGATATENKKQIKWEQGSPGGLIPIETVPLVNRATTAADVTAINGLLFRSVSPVTYVADASGNGGGGKQTAAGGGAY